MDMQSSSVIQEATAPPQSTEGNQALPEYILTNEGFKIFENTRRPRGDGPLNVPLMHPTLTSEGRKKLEEQGDQAILEGLTPPQAEIALTANIPGEMTPDARRQVRSTDRRSDMWITQSERSIGKMSLDPALEAIQKLSQENKWSVEQIDGAKKTLTEVAQKLNLTSPSLEVVVQDQFGVATAMLTELMKNIDQRSQTHYLNISNQGSELHVFPQLSTSDGSSDSSALIREEEDYADFVFALNQFIADLNHALEDSNAFVHIPTEGESATTHVAPSYFEEAPDESAITAPDFPSEGRVVGSAMVDGWKRVTDFFRRGLNGIRKPSEASTQVEEESQVPSEVLAEALFDGRPVMFPDWQSEFSKTQQTRVVEDVLRQIGLDPSITPQQARRDIFATDVTPEGALVVQIKPDVLQEMEFRKVSGERKAAKEASTQEQEQLQAQYDKAAQALSQLARTGEITFTDPRAADSIAVQDLVLNTVLEVLNLPPEEAFEPLETSEDESQATVRLKPSNFIRFQSESQTMKDIFTRKQLALRLRPSFT